MKYAVTFTICILLALGIMVLGPRWAHAQSADCGPRDKIAKFLSEKHGEARVALGLIDDTTIAEIFQSKDGETWTLLVSKVSGTSCIISTGKNWVANKPEVQGRDS